MKLRSRGWWEIGEVSCVLGMRVLLWIHRRFGRWPFRLCLWPVVIVYWALLPRARAASVDYLQRLHAAGAGCGSSRAYSSLGHFVRFGEVMLDKLLAVGGRFALQRFDGNAANQVRPYLERGVGGLFVTAHVGCVELSQQTALLVPGLRLTALVHTRHAERFNRLLGALRGPSSLQLLQVDEIDPGTVQGLAARVAAGEYVAIVGDRVPVGGGRVVRSMFLGAPAPFPIGPWVLAGLLECPVFMLACPGDGAGGYRLEIRPCGDRIALPRLQRDRVLGELVQGYALWLEGLLQNAPYDWLNFFDFWEQSGHESRKR